MGFRQRLERVLRDVPKSLRCPECSSRPETWVVLDGDPLAELGAAACPDCGWAPVVVVIVYSDPPLRPPVEIGEGWQWQG